jgi:hypothetical protein
MNYQDAYLRRDGKYFRIYEEPRTPEESEWRIVNTTDGLIVPGKYPTPKEAYEAATKMGCNDAEDLPF